MVQPYSNPSGPTSYAPVFGDISTRKGIQKGLTGQADILGKQAGTSALQRGSEFGTLMPGYSSLLSGGYSPQEKSSINESTLGAVNESYGGALDEARRHLARTGNAAGYGTFLSKMARGRSGDLAKQNLANQSAFADETMRRKMAGLEGIAKLYGVDTSFLSNLNELQNQVLGQAVNTYGIASQKQAAGGIGSKFLGALGGGLGMGFGGAMGAGLGKSLFGSGKP
jgi:hypothetical protein